MRQVFARAAFVFLVALTGCATQDNVATAPQSTAPNYVPAALEHFTVPPPPSFSAPPAPDAAMRAGNAHADSASPSPSPTPSPPPFFNGQEDLGNGVFYLSFADQNYFGYYGYLSNPKYLFHYDMGYEYLFDAADGKSGIYFYDFMSQHFWYTSPTFPFPYMYDFSLKSTIYYYPDPNNPGHYNTNGTRYFYVFSTGQIVTM